MNLEATLNKKIATKTASASGVVSPNTKTASAVADAVNAVTKTASPSGAASPLFDKLAADLAEQDKEGSVKLSHLYGAAICDGFMSQLGMYEKIAESLATQQNEKMASSVGTLQGESLLDPEFVALVKHAQENPKDFLALVQKAAEEEDDQLKEAEDKEAAELELGIQVKAAEHYLHGYEIGQLLVQK